MSAPAIHLPRPSRLFAYGSFAVMGAGWLAFMYALVASQDMLADVWAWVVDLPLVLELAVWLVGFPFLLGLAIWDASWGETVRVLAIAVVAVAYVLMFLPRERTR
jgi:hypothetical protein